MNVLAYNFDEQKIYLLVTQLGMEFLGFKIHIVQI